MTQTLAAPLAPGSQESFGLVAIPVAALLPGGTLRASLYLDGGDGNPPILYCERDHPITGNVAERLLSREIRTLYIPKVEYPYYQQYLRENLEAFLDDDRHSPSRRLQFLVEAARDVFFEALTKGDIDRVVREASRFGARLVGLSGDCDLTAYDVFGLLRHDDTAVTHATNVAVYGVLLAERLGIRRAPALEEIAVGSLLHDIGKRVISPAVLSKTGPLTHDDRRIVKRHPQVGFEDLCRRDDLTWGQLMMVYQHHERMDGRGYPMQLDKDEIHAMARICSVADVFDALSSERPFRRALPLSEALGFLTRQAGRGLDKEMVQCWRAAMTPRGCNR
jgi:HD-GYP domain-containing protein (c-di-GMP phosphodiesterase class II)